MYTHSQTSTHTLTPNNYNILHQSKCHSHRLPTYTHTRAHVDAADKGAREQLFILKLRQCTVVFDFLDADKDVHSKEIKLLGVLSV